MEEKVKMKDTVWFLSCEGQKWQSDLVLNAIIVVNVNQIIQAYKYTQQSYTLGNSKFKGHKRVLWALRTFCFLI